MRSIAFSRCALSLSAAVLLLASCGGSQPPIGAPGAIQQSIPIAAHVEHDGSWMLPGTSSESLLYVATHDDNEVRVYSYPEGKTAGTLAIYYPPGGGLCVDGKGDVFIPSHSVTYEFAHGGTTQVNQLDNPGNGFGCSYDPTTGNVAVSEVDDVYNPNDKSGDVAVFSPGSQQPTMYYASGIAFWYCGYDNQGNLYLAASDGKNRNPTKVQLMRLAKGGSAFEPISIDKPIYNDYEGGLWFPSVQWDGSYMTVSTVRRLVGRHGNSPVTIYRLGISGSSATVISETHLQSKTEKFKGQSWIEGNTIVALDADRDIYVSLWPYPKGGAPEQKIDMGLNESIPVGVTVSAASVPRK